MSRWSPLFAFLILSAAGTAKSQSNPPAAPANPARALTLEQAVQIALENHPALREAEAALEAAEAEVKQVRAGYFPQLSFSGIGKIGLPGATSALALPGFPASPFYRNVAYSANWYQTIFDFGRTKHWVASRKGLAQNARLKKQAEGQRIVLGVRRGYFSALEAERLEKLAEETEKERRLTLERAQAYFRAGMRSKLEVSLAQANLAEAKGNLIQTQRAMHTARAALRTAMGIESEDAVELREPAREFRSPPPENELFESALQKRPDFLALTAKITVLSEQVAEARSERRPEVRGFGAGGQARFNGTTVKPNQRHGIGAVGIFFPFYTGGRLKAEELEARAELDGALASRDLLRQGIRLEVASARGQLVDLASRIQAAAEQERAAREASRLARARYQTELASFLNLTTAEVALTRAETSHAQRVFEYQRAWAELDFATGEAFKPQP